MMIIREKYLKQVLRFLLPRKKRTKKEESEDKEEKQKEDPAPSWLQQKLAAAAFCLFFRRRTNVSRPVWKKTSEPGSTPGLVHRYLAPNLTNRASVDFSDSQIDREKISDLYFRQPLVDRRFFLHFIWSPKVIFNSMKGVFFRVVWRKANFRMTSSLKKVLSGSWIQTH